MSSNSRLSLALLLFCLSAFYTISLAANPQKILERYGLPQHLFPEEGDSGTLDPRTGTLKVHVSAPDCLIRLKAMMVRYDGTITAKILPSQLTDIDGVEVQMGSMWVPVTSVIVNDPKFVTVTTGSSIHVYPISVFEESHSCATDSLPYNSNLRWFSRE